MMRLFDLHNPEAASDLEALSESTRASAPAHPSRAAHASMPRDYVDVVRRRVLVLFRVHGPMTHEHLCRRYHAAHDEPAVAETSDSTIRTRCRELVDLGDVEDSGEKSQSRSGRPSTVWRAV